MSRNLILAIGALALGTFTAPDISSAQDYDRYQARAAQTAQTAQTETASAAETDPLLEKISFLQTEWARIKYQVPDKDSQLAAIQKLEDQAAQISAAYPDRAEPKIWEGIILSTDAGIAGGVSALGKVKKAKKLFEYAIQQNAKAMDGSAYTSLGSLYYQVPGWPIGFGDNKKAEQYLKYALQINADGIDPNFFYGDFLLQDGRLDEAKKYLEHALTAADRPGRDLADAGRRQVIKAALAQISKKDKDKKKSHFN